MELEGTTVVARPISEVFSYWADLERAGEWSGPVIERRKLSDAPAGVGTRYHAVDRLAGRRVEFTLEITAYEPAERMAAMWDKARPRQLGGDVRGDGGTARGCTCSQSSKPSRADAATHAVARRVGEASDREGPREVQVAARGRSSVAEAGRERRGADSLGGSRVGSRGGVGARAALLHPDARALLPEELHEDTADLAGVDERLGPAGALGDAVAPAEGAQAIALAGGERGVPTRRPRTRRGGWPGRAARGSSRRTSRGRGAAAPPSAAGAWGVLHHVGEERLRGILGRAVEALHAEDALVPVGELVAAGVGVREVVDRGRSPACPRAAARAVAAPRRPGRGRGTGSRDRLAEDG